MFRNKKTHEFAVLRVVPIGTAEHELKIGEQVYYSKMVEPVQKQTHMRKIQNSLVRELREHYQLLFSF